VEDLIPIEQAITIMHENIADLNLTMKDELFNSTSPTLNTEYLITAPTPVFDKRPHSTVSKNGVKVVNLIAPLQPLFNRNHINRFRRLLQQKKM